MERIELHPLCTLFPRMEGVDFQLLCDDIRDNGLREPITLCDGMILDGGNRFRACENAGIQPTFVEFSGSNIVSFVLSCNLHRRHLTPAQQAAIVSSAQNWAVAASHGGYRASVLVNTRLDTVRDRAAQSGASVMTQRRADAVAKSSPDVAKEVAQGKKTLSQAVREVAPEMAPRQPQREFQAREHGAEGSELERLRAELEEARENARELADSLQASMVLEEGQEATAAELKRLYALVTILESQRDQYMIKCNQLIATVKAKDRKIAKLEKGNA